MSFTSYSLALGSKQLRESEDQQTLRVQTLKINNERAIYKSINQSQKYKSKSQKYKSKSQKYKSKSQKYKSKSQKYKSKLRNYNL